MKRQGLLLLLFLLPFANDLLAQLCQGSLGDPLVNITFGSGSNPGLPLNAATTSYQYTAADCPVDGSYTVRSRTDRCYGGWHTLPTDHTGNPDGYFMLVNASYAPGAFYIDTVDLACSNTTYEFAAWVVNMNNPAECSGNPNRPNLTFTIEQTDGTVLQSYNSGDLPPQSTAVWRQIGFYFTTPSFVNRVVLKIRNNAPGGCGNDLALDDITFRPCGPKLAVTANGIANQLNLCTGKNEQVSFTANISTGFDNPFLQWQQSLDEGNTWTNIPTANALNLNYHFPATTPSGNYLFRLTASRIENSLVMACRVYSEAIRIKVNPLPVVSISTNTPLCENSLLRLQATGGERYNWNGVNGYTATGNTVAINNIQLAQAGRYFVTGTDVQGCEGKDSVDVVVNDAPKAVVGAGSLSVCEGETAQLSASGAEFYNWQPAQGLSSANVANPSASPIDTTVYTVVASNSNGCKDSTTVAVNVHRRPAANAGPDKEIGQGQRTTLFGFVSGTAARYNWSPPVAIDNINSLQPTVDPTLDQAYVLTAISGVGCGTATDTVLVKVYKGIFVPTAFTPNRDGKNDAWRIIGLSVYPSYEILVFNRYGQVIFRSKNAGRGWDGTSNGQVVPTGSYPYLIRIEGEKRVLKGLVNLIR